MIKRDYILRMIEEFAEALKRIRALKQGQRWDEAAGAVDGEFQRLMGAGALSVARLSETELLAGLIRGESTLAVHDKSLLLTTLLKEAGDVFAGQKRLADSRECYLKALHLLLNTLARREPGEFPEFVPQVEVLLAALQDEPLPVRTHACLMQHYERNGEFARAEDRFYAILDAEPERPEVLEFGIAFYQRLKTQSDAALAAGGLPRSELEAGLAELRNCERPSSEA